MAQNAPQSVILSPPVLVRFAVHGEFWEKISQRLNVSWLVNWDPFSTCTYTLEENCSHVEAIFPQECIVLLWTNCFCSTITQINMLGITFLFAHLWCLSQEVEEWWLENAEYSLFEPHVPVETFRVEHHQGNVETCFSIRSIGAAQAQRRLPDCNTYLISGECMLAIWSIRVLMLTISSRVWWDSLFTQGSSSKAIEASCLTSQRTLTTSLIWSKRKKSAIEWPQNYRLIPLYCARLTWDWKMSCSSRILLSWSCQRLSNDTRIRSSSRWKRWRLASSLSQSLAIPVCLLVNGWTVALFSTATSLCSCVKRSLTPVTSTPSSWKIWNGWVTRASSVRYWELHQSGKSLIATRWAIDVLGIVCSWQNPNSETTSSAAAIRLQNGWGVPKPSQRYSKFSIQPLSLW